MMNVGLLMIQSNSAYFLYNVELSHDTMVYVPDKDVDTIQNELNKAIDAAADWLDENELIINLKKGKTECLLFGTAKRLAKLNQPFTQPYRGHTLMETKDYRNEHFP